MGYHVGEGKEGLNEPGQSVCPGTGAWLSVHVHSDVEAGAVIGNILILFFLIVFVAAILSMILQGEV